MIEELKRIVAEEKDEIRRQYKAQIKAVFGSYARGDFHADSDLDLLVDGRCWCYAVGSCGSSTIFGGQTRV